MLQAHLDGANELFTDHRAHGSTEKAKLEGAGHDLETGELARHDDQRIALARLLLRLNDAVLVALGILEFQGVLGLHLDGDLPVRPRIQEFQQALARADAHVMTALRADVEVALDFGAVQDSIAGRALGPKPLGHRACTALGLDARSDDAFEPGHALEFTKTLRRVLE